jgi:cytochrome P450
MPAFRGPQIAAHADTLERVVKDAIADWRPGDVVDVQAWMQTVSLDIILRAVFGFESGARMQDLGSRLRGFLNDSKFNVALIGRLEASTDESAAWNAFRESFDQIRSLVRARVEEGKRRGTEGADVLSILLRARDERGQPLTTSDLTDQLLTLVVTGYETTATSVAWALYWLAKNDAALERLEREVTNAASPASGAYLDAVCKESLRISPIVPIVARQLQRDTTVGGWHLPEGVVATPCIYLAHRRESVFPDPGRFAPERFLEQTPSPYEYLPFGGGARRCLGMWLALAEMKTTLAAVVGRWRLRLTSDDVRAQRRSVTIAPSGGPKLIVEERAARRAS